MGYNLIAAVESRRIKLDWTLYEDWSIHFLSVKVSQSKMHLERCKIIIKKSVYVLNELLGSMVSLTLSVYGNTVIFSMAILSY